MNKVVITDEMVERFIAAGGAYQRGKSVQVCVKEGLEAALNSEPEIAVTADMKREGSAAIYREYWNRQTPHWTERAAVLAYRAMKRLEPR